VRLIESSDDVGGVIRTERVDGYLVESGPNSALNNSIEVEQVLDDLGLLQDRVFTAPWSRKRFIVRHGRPVALPLAPLAFIATPLLSSRAKWRLLAEPFARRPPDRDETVAEFVSRRLGQEVLDYAIDPFVSGVYAGDPHALSIRSTFPALYAMERDHGGLVRGALARIGRSKPPRPARRGIYSFRTGMAALPRAIGRALGERVWRKTSISGIARTTGGFCLKVDRENERFQLDAERVVVATPADRASNLLRPIAPSLADDLGAIAYAPVAAVFTGFPRSAVAHSLDGFGCLVPCREGRLLLGSLWSSSLFPNRAPEGMVALTNYLGGARHPELIDRSDDELARLALDDIAGLFGAQGPPAFVRVVRHARGIPQYLLAHDARVARIEAEVDRLPGLSIVGNYLRGVAVGECFGRGLALGRDLAASFRR
jgi:oxygen-dependent protoporphyrinogen oxidase